MNVILRKDLLESLRQRRIAAIQISFVLVMACLVIGGWPPDGILAIAMQGRDELLFGVIIGQLTLLTIFVPSVAATAIAREREMHTFEMLYASTVSPQRIVIGKTLSAMSFPSLLVVAGLPFVAMLVWRGDADLKQLVLSYAILVIAGLMLAIVSLTISAYSRQTSAAIIVSYITVLAICGGALVPASLILRESSGVLAKCLHYARSLSPLAAALSVLRPDAGDGQFGGRAQDGLLPLWKVFLPAAGVTIIGCFGALVAHLRKPPAERDATPAGAIAIENRSVGRKIMFLIDDRKQRKPLGSFNPVAGNERRTYSFRNGRWMIRTFYVSLVLALALAVMSLYGGVEHADLLAHVASILVVLQFSLIGIIDPILTCSAISSEIENGTFEMLRLTPLTSRALFWGKLLPSLPLAFLPVLALLPAYAAISFVDPGYLFRFLPLVPVVALSALLCCIAGLAASSLIDHTSRATVAAYLFCGMILALPLAPYLASGAQLSPRAAAWLSMPSPLAISFSLLTDASPELQNMWLVHQCFIAGLCAILLVVSRIRLTKILTGG